MNLDDSNLSRVLSFLGVEDCYTFAVIHPIYARITHGSRLMKLYLEHNAIDRAERIFIGTNIQLPELSKILVLYSTLDRALTHSRWLNILMYVGVPRVIGKETIRHIVRMRGTDDTYYLQKYKKFLGKDPGLPHNLDYDPVDHHIAPVFEREWPIWSKAISH